MKDDATAEMPVQYGPFQFQPDFTRARRDDGIEVTFTRGERRLLSFLSTRPGRIVSREQLLDAVSEVGSDRSDRSIDFMVNRLRRKLGDNARDPRLIGARYGEGYVWLPKPVAQQQKQKAAGAHVVVGPLRGLGALGPATALAERFAALFAKRFAPNFGPQRRLVLDPDCPHRSVFGEDAPTIGVDLTFLAEDGALDCVLHATEFRTGRTLTLLRHRIGGSGPGQSLAPAAIEDLASRVATEIWSGLARKSARQEPLTVAMQNASLSIAGGYHGWAESHRRLQALAAENPGDHAIRLMLATNIHTKYVQHGLEIFGSGADPTAEDEAEIEALVTASLPHVQHDPVLASTAANLLFFLGGGYRRMAIELLEEVNRTSTALASTLTPLGSFRYYVGQTELAMEALDIAQSLSEPGSEFEVYILCLKCQALMAVDDRPRLDPVLALLYQRRPGIRFLYDILYGRPEALTPEAEGMLAMLTPQKARGILMFADYLCARHFTYADHRENTLKLPRAILSARFGPSVIPPPMRRSVVEGEASV